MKFKRRATNTAKTIRSLLKNQTEKSLMVENKSVLSLLIQHLNDQAK